MLDALSWSVLFLLFFVLLFQTWELAAWEEMPPHGLLSSRATLEDGLGPWRGCGGPKLSDV